MSWDINQVTLIGRLTKDPILRYSSQGNAYCQLGIAVGRKSFSKDTKEDDVYFFNVIVFGKIAEISGEYLNKGKQVGLSGYIRQRRWEKEGEKFSSVEIVAEKLQFLSPANKLNHHNDVLDSDNISSSSGIDTKVKDNKNKKGSSYEEENSEYSSQSEDIPF